MKKLYTIAGCLAVAAAATQAVAQEAYYFYKGVNVDPEDATAVHQVNIIDGSKLVAVDKNGTELFSRDIADIEGIHLEAPFMANNTMFAKDFWNYSKVNIDLVKGQVVEIAGMDGAVSRLQGGLFATDDEGVTTFRGQDGNYNLWYLAGNHNIFILENQGYTFDANKTLWVNGRNYGPNTAYTGTTQSGAWTWNTDPHQSVMVQEVEPGIYETEIWLGADFYLQFYKQRGKGELLHPLGIVPYTNDKIRLMYNGDEATGYGYYDDNLAPGANFTPGAYKLRLDLNKGALILLDGSVDVDAVKPLSINGVEFKNGSDYVKSSDRKIDLSEGDLARYPGIVFCEVDLVNGQEVSLTNIPDISKAVSPDMLVEKDGKLIFNGPTTRYRVMYKTDRALLYFEPNPYSASDDYIWLIGKGTGHPCQHSSNHYVAADFSPWFSVNRIPLFKQADGSYQCTMFIENDGYFYFRNGQANNGTEIPAQNCELVGGNGTLGWHFGHSNLQGAGSYTINVNLSGDKPVVTYKKLGK